MSDTQAETEALLRDGIAAGILNEDGTLTKDGARRLAEDHMRVNHFGISRAAQPKPEVEADDEALILNFESAIEVLSDPDRDEYADEVALAQAELDLNAAREALRRRIAELRAELARWQSGELCTAKDAANNLHNLEVLGCANRRAEIAEARVAELEAAQIPTPPEGMHYELVRDGTTPRQRANHKRHARHIAIMMNRKTT